MDTTTDLLKLKSGEFDEGKCWFTRRGNVLTIGITQPTVDGLGEIESLELPEEGDRFSVGDILLTLEGSSDTVEVEAICDGVVLDVNLSSRNIEIAVEKLEDPMEEGWILKIQMDTPALDHS